MRVEVVVLAAAVEGMKVEAHGGEVPEQQDRDTMVVSHLVGHRTN
jgi:hypothetical protein